MRVGAALARSYPRAHRVYADELSVLTDSYDMLKKAKPDTPLVYFVRALYHENQRTFEGVTALAACL